MISIKRVENGKVNYEIYFNKEDLLFIKRYITLDNKKAHYDIATLSLVGVEVIENIEFQIKGGSLTTLSIKKDECNYYKIMGLENEDKD